MLALSLAQGLALLGLWRAANDGVWPSQTPALNFPLWTVAIVWPGLLLLCIDAVNWTRALAMASAFAVAAALLAAYLGWQASPFGAFSLFSLLGYAIASLLLACFTALLYLQPWALRQRITYDVLFALSWRNFLVAVLAALAVAIFYMVLLLWGMLFSAIGIAFFQQIFAEAWFLFPALATAFGFAIHVFRRLVHLIDGIAGLLEGLLRLLLPLAVGLQTAFLAVLPFTGLAPLWETGNGTLLLLCLNGFVLFSANAVYQPDIKAPYPAIVHRLLYVGIALLPAITVLAAYGLYLRIAQHGWSVGRCWGVTTCAFFGLLCVGYAWCIVRQRDAWPSGLGRVNAAMGVLVLAVMLLVNSPLLDFRVLSMASQWQRVESGELAVREFDFHYAKENLARPGWLKMQALIAEYETADPSLAQMIREPEWQPPRLGRQAHWQRMRYRPDSLAVPSGVRDTIDRLMDGDWNSILGFPVQGADTLIGTDLNADGEEDYVLVRISGDNAAAVHVYAGGDGAWRSAVLVPRNRLPRGTDVRAMLRDGEIGSVERIVHDLKVGDLVLGTQYEQRWPNEWVAVEPPRRD